MNEGSQLDRPQLTKLDSFGEAEVDVINLKKKIIFISKKLNCGVPAFYRGCILASHPAAPGLIPSVPKKIQRKN